MHDLEQRILQLHGALCVRTTVERAAAIGELLLEGKAVVGHGRFGTWLRQFPFSHRMACAYTFLRVIMPNRPCGRTASMTSRTM